MTLGRSIRARERGRRERGRRATHEGGCVGAVGVRASNAEQVLHQEAPWDREAVWQWRESGGGRSVQPRVQGRGGEHAGDHHGPVEGLCQSAV